MKLVDFGWMWRNGEEVNFETQVQKTEPGAPSVSIHNDSERNLLTRATRLR